VYKIYARGGDHGNNVATIIYAPDSTVDFGGNAEFYGGFVVKSFESKGTAVLSRRIESAENPIGIIIDTMSSELWGE
ncbi:MAG TPA: hypothetical protein PLT43_11470, partial [Mesotoga sp.]|nr:hypothetical protein [Mesotoga sp.]